MNFLFAILLTFFVRTQSDFDSLQDRIDSAFESGQSGIDIQLDSSVFFFKEGHLTFIERKMPGFAINITGRGAVISGEDDDSPFSPGKGFVDLDNLEDFDPATNVKKARFWPLKVPFRKKIYCIPVDEPDMSESEAENVYIVLSQWFHGMTYKVVKISGGILYFRRDSKDGPRMHTELRFGRCLPRYLIVSPPESGGLHRCSASSFIMVRNSSIGTITLDGVHFLGNSDKDNLIHFHSSEIDSVVVENCRFEGLRSNVISLYDTDNLRYRNNFMYRCYRSGIFCDHHSDDCSVTDNTFIDSGRMMVHNSVVNMQGKGFLVRNNLFEDFSYNGIGVGTHYTSDYCTTEGIIVGNELRMSEEFRKGVPRMLIDGGAIYICTQNKNVVIHDNYIHDISGPHGNRGILADDGSVNLTISGNRVMNVSPSFCIDIRKAKRIGWRAKSKIKKVNIGNKIFDNVYDGRIRIYVDKYDKSSMAYNNIKINQL